MFLFVPKNSTARYITIRSGIALIFIACVHEDFEQSMIRFAETFEGKVINWAFKLIEMGVPKSCMMYKLTQNQCLKTWTTNGSL